MSWVLRVDFGSFHQNNSDDATYTKGW